MKIDWNHVRRIAIFYVALAIAGVACAAIYGFITGH